MEVMKIMVVVIMLSSILSVWILVHLSRSLNGLHQHYIDSQRVSSVLPVKVNSHSLRL